MKILARSLTILALLVVAQPAFTAPGKTQAAEDDATRLKKKGDAAMLELRYEDALDAYASSYALTPNPALHYNRARALEALGRYADALTAYEQFGKNATPELRAKVPQLDEHIAGIRKRVTELTIRVPVKGARITLRNVVLGSSPLAPLRVNAGKAQLEVTADGYVPYAKEIELVGGDSLSLDIELTARVGIDDGLLIIDAEPPATVTVDGKTIGTSPVEARVGGGSHTVTLARSGYVTRKTTIELASGEKKRLTLSLEAESGITSRWWFWTGVTAVVITGTVLTISLATSRDAGRGDIDPGRVSAPLLSF